jgi:lipoprotein LprG
MHSSRTRPALWAVGVLTVILLAGCSNDQKSAASPADSTALLTAARTSLAGASTVHFTLTSTDVPTDGTRLVDGQGVIVRPKQFQGNLSILISGNKVSVELISAGGKVYAKLPFSNSFQVTNPSDFGLSDPAKLIDPNTGIARMFGELTAVTNKGQLRVGNDVVTQLNGALPGTLVDALLTDADPAQPVQTELYITKDTHQLRRVVMTGPIYTKGVESTFNLLLDQYSAPATVTAPPTAK